MKIKELNKNIVKEGIGSSIASAGGSFQRGTQGIGNSIKNWNSGYKNQAPIEQAVTDAHSKTLESDTKYASLEAIITSMKKTIDLFNKYVETENISKLNSAQNAISSQFELYKTTYEKIFRTGVTDNTVATDPKAESILTFIDNLLSEETDMKSRFERYYNFFYEMNTKTKSFRPGVSADITAFKKLYSKLQNKNTTEDDAVEDDATTVTKTNYNVEDFERLPQQHRVEIIEALAALDAAVPKNGRDDSEYNVGKEDFNRAKDKYGKMGITLTIMGRFVEQYPENGLKEYNNIKNYYESIQSGNTSNTGFAEIPDDTPKTTTNKTLKKSELEGIINDFKNDNVNSTPFVQALSALLKASGIIIGESLYESESTDLNIKKMISIAGEDMTKKVLTTLAAELPSLKKDPAIQKQINSKEIEVKSSKPKAYAKLLYSVLVKSNQEKRVKYINRLNSILFQNTLKLNGQAIEFEDLLQIIKYISNPTAMSVSESINVLLYDFLDRENIFNQALELGKEMFLI